MIVLFNTHAMIFSLDNSNIFTLKCFRASINEGYAEKKDKPIYIFFFLQNKNRHERYILGNTGYT